MKKDVIKYNTTGEIFFFCPGCECAHKINDTWQWNGDMVKPTFSPSVLVRGYNEYKKADYVCHSFVRDGKIEFLSDSTHDLTGKTVELEPFGNN